MWLERFYLNYEECKLGVCEDVYLGIIGFILTMRNVNKRACINVATALTGFILTMSEVKI